MDHAFILANLHENTVAILLDFFCVPIFFYKSQKPTWVQASVKFQSEAHNPRMVAEWYHTNGRGWDGRIERLVDGSDGILASVEDLENEMSANHDDEKTKASLITCQLGTYVRRKVGEGCSFIWKIAILTKRKVLVLELLLILNR